MGFSKPKAKPKPPPPPPPPAPTRVEARQSADTVEGKVVSEEGRKRGPRSRRSTTFISSNNQKKTLLGE